MAAHQPINTGIRDSGLFLKKFRGRDVVFPLYRSCPSLRRKKIKKEKSMPYPPYPDKAIKLMQSLTELFHSTMTSAWRRDTVRHFNWWRGVLAWWRRLISPVIELRRASRRISAKDNTKGIFLFPECFARQYGLSDRIYFKIRTYIALDRTLLVK